MKPIIDFEECLKDSPKFRSTLEDQESDIETLELKLDKILKSCGSMVDAGKMYITQQNLFVNSLWDLSSYFREDTDVIVCMNKLIHAFQEIHKFHAILLDQASRTILKNLTSFIKTDIKSVKELKHSFEKISNDLDAALVRNSSTPKTRPTEAEDSLNMLCATRSCFRHTALDYVHTISIIQSKKRYEILGTLLSYMHACNAFFHQGTDLCQDLDPFFKKLEKEVDSMRKESGKLEKEMENRHVYVTSHDIVAPSGNGTSHNMIRMEGYLFKRTSNAFKTWNRRWFMLHDTKLVYRKRSGEDPGTIMEEDLRLCTVKPMTEGDRRFCFEVLSPSKSHVLQADSEEMLHHWMGAMQNGISAALQRSLTEHETSFSGTTDTVGGTCSAGPSSIAESFSSFDSLSSSNRSEKNRGTSSASSSGGRTRLYKQLLKIPGNDRCCDCGHEEPRWCSINLGITFCIECSGVHRSLGVHYSKVRSLTLDDWDKQPEILKVMAELGNSIVNRVYEANVPSDFTRASPNCASNIREAWIKAKYLERRFIKKLSPLPSPANLTTSSNASDSDLGHSNRLSTVRKWSVRKVRRRPRSTDAKKDKHSPFKDNKTVEEQDEESGKEKTDSNKEANKEEVFLFGQNLDKQPLLETLDLDSDQDSTGGEEENEIGQEDISNLSPNLLLYKAAAAHNLPIMCEALALGADKLWINPDDRDRSHLHQAILSGSVMACEYLILNGSKINCQDKDGKTPLYLATELGHTAQAALLLKHKANQHLKDREGVGPLTVAMNQVNADIVTLLRLSELNDQIKASEQGSTGDDTFYDVVRDFSQLAYTHPERLSRVPGANENTSH